MSFEGVSLTYRELDEASNRLAHLLADRGVGPGQRVALLLPRSAEAVVAILAVREDRGGLCADRPGGARRRGWSSCWPMPRRSRRSPPPGWPTGWTGAICWSSMSTIPRVDGQPGTALPAPAPDDIAYIIYTSGTTGVPQGGGDPAPQRDPAAGDAGCRHGVWPGRCGRSVIRWRSTSRCGRSGVRCCYGGRLVVVPDSVVRSPEDFHALLVAEAGHCPEPDPVGVLCAAGRRCAAARAGPAAQARGRGVRRGSAGAAASADVAGRRTRVRRG